MKVRSLFAVSVLAMLCACSYMHGVTRTLSFEDDISDLSCIAATLKDMGYQTIWSQENWVSYYSEDPILRANFGYALITIEGDVQTVKNKLTHSVNFGSGPEPCRSVKAAGAVAVEIETQVLASCKLTPVKIEQDMSCKRF